MHSNNDWNQNSKYLSGEEKAECVGEKEYRTSNFGGSDTFSERSGIFSYTLSKVQRLNTQMRRKSSLSNSISQHGEYWHMERNLLAHEESFSQKMFADTHDYSLTYGKKRWKKQPNVGDAFSKIEPVIWKSKPIAGYSETNLDPTEGQKLHATSTDSHNVAFMTGIMDNQLVSAHNWENDMQKLSKTTVDGKMKNIGGTEVHKNSPTCWSSSLNCKEKHSVNKRVKAYDVSHSTAFMTGLMDDHLKPSQNWEADMKLLVKNELDDTADSSSCATHKPKLIEKGFHMKTGHAICNPGNDILELEKNESKLQKSKLAGKHCQVDAMSQDIHTLPKRLLTLDNQPSHVGKEPKKGLEVDNCSRRNNDCGSKSSVDDTGKGNSLKSPKRVSFGKVSFWFIEPKPNIGSENSKGLHLCQKVDKATKKKIVTSQKVKNCELEKVKNKFRVEALNPATNVKKPFSSSEIKRKAMELKQALDKKKHQANNKVPQEIKIKNKDNLNNIRNKYGTENSWKLDETLSDEKYHKALKINKSASKNIVPNKEDSRKKTEKVCNRYSFVEKMNTINEPKPAINMLKEQRSKYKKNGKVSEERSFSKIGGKEKESNKLKNNVMHEKPSSKESKRQYEIEKLRNKSICKPVEKSPILRVKKVFSSSSLQHKTEKVKQPSDKPNQLLCVQKQKTKQLVTDKMLLNYKIPKVEKQAVRKATDLTPKEPSTMNKTIVPENKKVESGQKRKTSACLNVVSTSDEQAKEKSLKNYQTTSEIIIPETVMSPLQLQVETMRETKTFKSKSVTIKSLSEKEKSEDNYDTESLPDLDVSPRASVSNSNFCPLPLVAEKIDSLLCYDKLKSGIKVSCKTFTQSEIEIETPTSQLLPPDSKNKAVGLAGQTSAIEPQKILASEEDNSEKSTLLSSACRPKVNDTTTGCSPTSFASQIEFDSNTSTKIVSSSTDSVCDGMKNRLASPKQLINMCEESVPSAPQANVCDGMKNLLISRKPLLNMPARFVPYTPQAYTMRNSSRFEPDMYMPQVPINNTKCHFSYSTSGVTPKSYDTSNVSCSQMPNLNSCVPYAVCKPSVSPVVTNSHNSTVHRPQHHISYSNAPVNHHPIGHEPSYFNAYGNINEAHSSIFMPHAHYNTQSNVYGTSGYCPTDMFTQYPINQPDSFYSTHAGYPNAFSYWHPYCHVPNYNPYAQGMIDAFACIDHCSDFRSLNSINNNGYGQLNSSQNFNSGLQHRFGLHGNLIQSNQIRSNTNESFRLNMLNPYLNSINFQQTRPLLGSCTAQNPAKEFGRFQQPSSRAKNTPDNSQNQFQISQAGHFARQNARNNKNPMRQCTSTSNCQFDTNWMRGSVTTSGSNTDMCHKNTSAQEHGNNYIDSFSEQPVNVCEGPLGKDNLSRSSSLDIINSTLDFRLADDFMKSIVTEMRTSEVLFSDETNETLSISPPVLSPVKDNKTYEKKSELINNDLNETSKNTNKEFLADKCSNQDKTQSTLTEDYKNKVKNETCNRQEKMSSYQKTIVKASDSSKIQATEKASCNPSLNADASKESKLGVNGSTCSVGDKNYVSDKRHSHKRKLQQERSLLGMAAEFLGEEFDKQAPRKKKKPAQYCYTPEVAKLRTAKTRSSSSQTEIKSKHKGSIQSTEENKCDRKVKDITKKSLSCEDVSDVTKVNKMEEDIKHSVSELSHCQKKSGRGRPRRQSKFQQYKETYCQPNLDDSERVSEVKIDKPKKKGLKAVATKGKPFELRVKLTDIMVNKDSEKKKKSADVKNGSVETNNFSKDITDKEATVFNGKTSGNKDQNYCKKRKNFLVEKQKNNKRRKMKTETTAETVQGVTKICSAEGSAAETKCQVCKRKFLSSEHNAHMKSFHPKHCEVCYQEFQNKTAKRKHKVVHATEIYECVHCGREFTQNWYLNTHLRWCKKKQTAVSVEPTVEETEKAAVSITDTLASISNTEEPVPVKMHHAVELTDSSVPTSEDKENKNLEAGSPTFDDSWKLLWENNQAVVKQSDGNSFIINIERDGDFESEYENNEQLGINDQVNFEQYKNNEKLPPNDQVNFQQYNSNEHLGVNDQVNVAQNKYHLDAQHSVDTAAQMQKREYTDFNLPLTMTEMVAHNPDQPVESLYNDLNVCGLSMLADLCELETKSDSQVNMDDTGFETNTSKAGADADTYQSVDDNSVLEEMIDLTTPFCKIANTYSMAL